MGELLLDSHLPRLQPIEGRLNPSESAGLEGGWRATLSPFEAPPQVGPGSSVLDRLELEIWWSSGGNRRRLTLDGYRRTRIAMSGARP
jgi:hypothetical protein